MSVSFRQQYQEYIKHHAEQIVSFAKTGHARHRRGIILAGWPSLNLRHVTNEVAYLPEAEVKQRLKKLQTPGEPNLADEIIQAVQHDDPAWEAVILFLDDVNKTSDLHDRYKPLNATQ